MLCQDIHACSDSGKVNILFDNAKIQEKNLNQSQKNQFLYVFFDAPCLYDTLINERSQDVTVSSQVLP